MTKYLIGEIKLVDKMHKWINEVDADELARLAGEMFGGYCWQCMDTTEIFNTYVFEPNNTYGDAFDDLTPVE